MEAMARLMARLRYWTPIWLASLLVLSLGCQPGPSASELGMRATIETLRDELNRLQTPTPQVVAAEATPTPSAPEALDPLTVPTVAPTVATLPDSRLLDWRPVNQQAAVGDLELQVHALLLGQDSYGTVYGSTITAGPGRKILLADVTLKYGFRPAASPYEIHVDYFVIANSDGLEFRGIPVPSVGNALPDRFFVSSGQMHRGIVAFIVPSDLESGLLYFTNFLGGKEPPERLLVNLWNIPVRGRTDTASSPPAATVVPTQVGAANPARAAPPPSSASRLLLVEPFLGMGTVDGLLTIQWRSRSPDSPLSGTVTLLYSPENVSGGGTPIDEVPAATGVYRWDTTRVPQGTYWILARLAQGDTTEQRYSSVPFSVFRELPDSAASGGSTGRQGGPGPRTVLDERFDSNRVGWRSDRAGTAWLGEDGYHLYGRDPGRFVAVGVPTIGPLRDVAVTTTFRWLEAGLSAGFGVIVRDQGAETRDGLSQSGRFYVLKVGDRSDLDAWRREDDRWADLLPLTHSGALRRGRGQNQLTVLAHGERLSLLVNGVQVAEVSDPAPVAGRIGLFVHGDYSHVLIERIVVQPLS